MTTGLTAVEITKANDALAADAGGGVPADRGLEENITFVYGRLDAIPDGTSNTVLFAEKYDAVDSQASHTGGVNVCWGDGSVRNSDTSAVAKLMDFDFPSSLGEPVTFTLTVSADSPATTVKPSFVKSWSTSGDADDRPTDAGADYSGSHILYQDVFIPAVDTGPAVAIETVTIAHEGYWY